MLTKKQTKETRRCVDCHSAPCFRVDLFQSNLYSVLEFYRLLYFKIQKLVEKYMYYCIYLYLAELLIVSTCRPNICL